MRDAELVFNSEIAWNTNEFREINAVLHACERAPKCVRGSHYGMGELHMVKGLSMCTQNALCSRLAMSTGCGHGLRCNISADRWRFFVSYSLLWFTSNWLHGKRLISDVKVFVSAAFKKCSQVWMDFHIFYCPIFHEDLPRPLLCSAQPFSGFRSSVVSNVDVHNHFDTKRQFQNDGLILKHFGDLWFSPSYSSVYLEPVINA